MTTATEPLMLIPLDDAPIVDLEHIAKPDAIFVGTLVRTGLSHAMFTGRLRKGSRMQVTVSGPWRDAEAGRSFANALRYVVETQTRGALGSCEVRVDADPRLEEYRVTVRRVGA